MSENNLHGLVPIEILSRSIDERIAWFHQKFVAHRNIAQARDQLMQVIHNPGPTTIVTLYGSPGSGKTTLCLRIRQILNEEALANPDKFVGRIPAPGVSLDPSDNSRFDWPALYYRPALESLHEPLLDQKISYKLESVQDAQTGNWIQRKNIVKADLRNILISTMKNRRPIIFWVDDAQYLTKVSSGSQLINQIDSIKGLSDSTKVMHVLFGTYDLLSLIGLRPEVGRRTHQVHLSRYRKETPKDWDEFEATLNTFQLNLPLKRQPNLVAHAEYLYEQSLGCIGILKDRLEMVLIDVLRNGHRTILPSHWAKYETPKWELSSMNQLIKEGEENLQIKMGEGKFASIIPQKAPVESKTKSGNLKPGERKPGHDPVGSN